MDSVWDRFPFIREAGISFIKWRWRAAPFLLSRAYYRRFADDIDGTSIWAGDWDLLVILDTCRPQWLIDVSTEYPWIESIDSRYSVASHSEEFIEKSFEQGPHSEIENTLYVTANPFAKQHHLNKFRHSENVLKYDGEEYTTPSPPAHVVTDRAVTLGRQQDWNQIIVHYMQPHHPFYQKLGDRKDIELTTKESHPEFLRSRLRLAHATEEVHNAYRDNLRYVLDEVDILRKNINAEKAVITSDHGQALGEAFCYDHISGMNHPEMREVPWATFSTHDTGSLVPKEYSTQQDKDASRDQLEALGYL